MKTGYQAKYHNTILRWEDDWKTSSSNPNISIITSTLLYILWYFIEGIVSILTEYRKLLFWRHGTS